VLWVRSGWTQLLSYCLYVSGSASDVDWRRAASVALACLWSLQIAFRNYEVSHSSLGLAHRLSPSNISFDLLRSSAPSAVTSHSETGYDGFRQHTLTFIMLSSSCIVRRTGEQVVFLIMFCSQFYSSSINYAASCVAKLILKQICTLWIVSSDRKPGIVSSDRKPGQSQPPANKIYPRV
jgi:hypothetical protein